MNEQATRMLFATVAVSALAALLASTGNARIPEGNGVHSVPAQSRHGTVAKPQQATKASVALDPAIWAAILRNNTRLTTNPSIPYVDPSTFDGYRG